MGVVLVGDSSLLHLALTFTHHAQAQTHTHTTFAARGKQDSPHTGGKQTHKHSGRIGAKGNERHERKECSTIR